MKFICLTGNRLLVVVLVMFTLILSEIGLKAQNNVGIGTPTPNINAVLDLVSPQGNQGVLVPRLSTSQRQAMSSSLGTAETGLVVFDRELKQFFHWVDNIWVVGLGAFSDIAGGDLEGNFPNPTLRPDAVNSTTILDGSIATEDIGLGTVTSGHIDAEGNGNAVLGTDAGGLPRWEPKTNFLGNTLGDGNIMIGDAANTAQPRTVSGDISLSNDGTVIIADNAITSAKISDNSITASDIATDAVAADEIASGAVGSDEIVDGSIQSTDLADGAVTSSKIQDGTVATGDIESGGNNKVLITTGAGTVFWENISLFETSTLPEGNVFVGDVSNTAAPLNASGAGRILIGDGTSVLSLNVNGDLSLSASGDAQINSGVVGSTEVTDNSLTAGDIAADAIESSELADDAVDNNALQDDAISNAKIQDNAISTGKIQDDAINTQKIATGAVTSNELADGTIATADLADDAVSTAKLNGEGNNNSVLTTTGSGDPQWESRSNFGTSSLPNANIFVGDVGGTSQPRPVSGDISMSNIGNVQINNDVIATAEVVDNSLTVDDIGPNSIESSELADNAVDVGAIQSDAVTTPKIADDAVSTAKIDGGGNNNAILTTDVLGNPQWETKASLDVDPINEIQDLSLAGNTLSLSADPTTVDLSGYLDNTDSQDLTDVLSQGSDAGGSAITNLANPTGAQDAATKGYVDALDAADADGDPSNEIQDLSLTGNTLTLTSDPTNVDLSGYLDNTDAQDLSLAGNTLSLTGDATNVDLSGYLDNTDAQDMSLAGNTLSLTGDATPVDLAGYLDNTDSQDLSDVLSQGNDAGGSAITNAANPTNAQDVATKDYVDNITITASNMSVNSISSNNIVNGSITSADIGTGEISTPNIEDGAVNSAKIEDLSIVDADISNSANISASKLQATIMTEGENVSLLNNDAGYLTSVNSANITDGTVVNADVSNTANIAATKLQSTVIVEGENVSLLNNDAGYLTSVASANITNGTIVNADVSASAAIDGSKINPDFGSQNIQTSGTLNTGSATVSSITVSDLGGANDTYTGDGAVNSFTISAAGAFSSSDIRLKQNIEEIPAALQKIALVSGKSYTFINDAQQKVHYGVIAQDIQKIFPHLVQENEQGYLSVNYLELIPVLVEALKAQQATIEQLSQALGQGQEINSQLKAELTKQRQLLQTQQFIITQLQMDRATTEKDIKEIKQSLGLEAKE